MTSHRAIALVLALTGSMLAPSPAGAVETWTPSAAAPDDETLARTIQSKISGRPGVDVSRVSVAVHGGSLDLSGTVATLYERTQIEDLASAVRGLVSVTDRIAVERADRSDALLQDDARRAIDASPRLRASGLRASVSDGVLTLEGEVAVLRERLDAEESASRIPGVVEIRNLIRLAPRPVDPSLIERRLSSLLSQRLVTGGIEGLKVAVTPEGQVTISGTATTHADRRLAERIAYGVSGVAAVVNLVQVRRFTGAPAP